MPICPLNGRVGPQPLGCRFESSSGSQPVRFEPIFLFELDIVASFIEAYNVIIVWGCGFVSGAVM